MELSHLATRLQVTHRPSIAKAKEYQRLLRMKQPKAGSSVEAQSVGCLELACQFHQQSIEPSLFLKYSLCKTPTAYSKCLASLRDALGLQATLSTRELALQFGCVQVHDLAKKALEVYKSKSLAAASSPAAAEVQRSLLSTRNVYPCAVFFLSCKHLKIAGVERRRLLGMAGVSEREFSAVCESVLAQLPELRPPEKSPAKPRKRKAGAEGEEEGEDAAEQKDGDDPHAHDESIPLPEEERVDGPRRSPAKKQRAAPKKKLQEEEEEDEDPDKPKIVLAKRGRKPRTISALLSSTPLVDDNGPSALLQQSKLNFAPASASSASAPFRSQLRPDSGDEGEAEF